MNQRLSSAARNTILAGAAVIFLLVFAWAVSRLRPQPVVPGGVLTETVTVTATPPAPTLSPTSEPAGKNIFTNKDAGVTFEYPAGWSPSPDNPVRVAGPEGFFTFQELTGGAGSLMQICEQSANDGAYGDRPQIELGASGNHTLCVITSSLNRAADNQNSVIFADDESADDARYFILSGWDPAQFASILASIQFVEAEQPPSAGEPMATPDPNLPVTEINPNVQQAAGVTIEEYPVVGQEVDSPSHFEFNQRIPPAVFEKRQAWRGYDPARLVDANNRLLEPFGYRLAAAPGENDSLFELYRLDELLQAEVVTIMPVFVNQSGNDFLMQIETQDGQSLIAQNAGLRPWDASQHFYLPAVIVGNHVTWVEPLGDLNTVGVRKGDEIVFSYHIASMRPDNPVKALWADGDHWVLEIDGLVFVDGELLNEQIGASEVFGWQLVDGEPLYFFKRDGLINLSYAGETLPVAYSEVVHYRCCEPAAFNVNGNGSMAWFYALRDGIWHYVEIGKFE